MKTPVVVRSDGSVEEKGEKEYRALVLSGKVLAMVSEFWKREYRPPTIRDLCVMSGVNSTSHMRWILEKLAEGGHLVMVEVPGATTVKSYKYYYPLWIKDAIDAGKPSDQ